MGGMQAWQGKTLSGYPKVKIFDKDQSLKNLLATAMDLEKGALRFFDFLRVAAGISRSAFFTLSTCFGIEVIVVFFFPILLNI